MSFAAVAARMEDSVFTRGGSDALWKVGGSGDGIPCKIILARPDVVERFGDERALLPTVMLKVRSNEIATAAQGDSVMVGSDTFTIIAEPLMDKYRLVWACEAAPAS
jgi:hypothetical protein